MNDNNNPLDSSSYSEMEGTEISSPFFSLENSTCPELPTLRTPLLAKQHTATEFDIEDDSTEIDNKKSQHKGSGIMSILFNLVNTTVGAGILALPFAFKEAGVVFGPILLLIVSLMSMYTLFLLISSSDMANKFSYKELAERVFPYKITGFIFGIVIILFCFGTLVGYCVILGQFLEIQMNELLLYLSGGYETEWTVQFSNRALLIGLPMVVLIFPLCTLRHIHFLSYTSFLSIVSAMFVVVVVIFRFIQAEVRNTTVQSELKFIGSAKSIFIAFPIICFSMASHITLLPMYESMKKRSGKVMKAVSGVSVFACFLVYISIGLTGYLNFKDETKDNILNNFSNRDPLAISAKLCITLVVILSYPLVHFACRESLDNLLFQGKPFSSFRWVTEAAIICGLAFAISVVVPNLQTVFGVVGATTGTLVVYTFPALLYFMLAKNWIFKIIALLVMLASVGMGITSTVAIIVDALKFPIP